MTNNGIYKGALYEATAYEKGERESNYTPSSLIILGLEITGDSNSFVNNDDDL